ncbi:porin [Sediminitomix flava]|uniref:Phosphate-selective porin O/P n=1 Tax=Sediminitomix flava TaxID=379075 RepID=A0A315Z833_SEDFL|nr:porin [Sediminitomix flava]PWJ39196.1 phosphate-selective porin O/P [Sediminitomix flava]
MKFSNFGFITVLLLAVMGLSRTSVAQDKLVSVEDSINQELPQVEMPTPPRKWFETIKISGYVQSRYNGLFETNPDLAVEQMDKNWGADKGLSLRRVRVKVSGWIHEKVYMYIQGDFAGEFSLKDAYMDLYLDDNKSLWVRAGQSKVPFGYENMQSSQHRLPLDRSDAINSALKNERDMMAVLYYTPEPAREVYKYLKANNLKHSGNYGAFALGAFNGQTANKKDENDNLHTVVRASYPFQFANDQIMELSVHAYTGKYVTTSVSEGVGVSDASGERIADDANGYNFIDRRVGATFVWYPQPIGFQAEYNYGEGPEYDGATNTIKVQDLHGAYAMVMGKFDIGHHTFFPFTRYIYYDGGKKFELDARSYEVNDLEIGIEWQPHKAFELVAMYVFADRRYDDSASSFNDGVYTPNYQAGNILRLQAQINF